MNSSAQPTIVTAKNRSGYRRLLWFTALLVFGTIGGWMIWGGIRDWADARALESYFAELETREPGWKDRVYGKPLTPQQMDDHQKWGELNQLLSTALPAWGPYRGGLYGGMYQDPAHPAAMLPAEQVEFMKAAHEFWQPVMQKVAAMGKLPGQHRSLDKDAPYEKMINQFSMNGSIAYVINEGVELEVMYHIMMNDPERAFKWFTGCKPPSSGYLYASPFLIERWLNLTQPQAKTLLQMQQMLEQNSQWSETYGFPGFGSELRLLEKSIRELSNGELTHKQLDRMGFSQTLLGKDSPWDALWLKWARPYYLDLKLHSIFHRPDHLILRLHQLADRLEELPKLDPVIRWSTWKHFAETHSIMIDRKDVGKPTTLTTYSDTVPEGLHLLRASYLHVQVMYLFDTQAQLNTALAAVVAERFRLDHGRFPNDWTELSPHYISKPILDPYTGKPLLIKLNEKGIVLYSAGRDGKNEDGENLSNHHYWFYGGKGWDKRTTNLGTRVYLPALRRGPAVKLDEQYSESLLQSTPEMLKLMKEGSEKKE